MFLKINIQESKIQCREVETQKHQNLMRFIHLVNITRIYFYFMQSSHAKIQRDTKCHKFSIKKNISTFLFHITDTQILKNSF